MTYCIYDFSQWANQDLSGYWSVNKICTLSIESLSITASKLKYKFEVYPLGTPGSGTVCISVKLNDEIDVTHFELEARKVSYINITAEAAKLNKITFIIHHIASPRDLGLSSDNRLLGFRLQSIDAVGAVIGQVFLGAVLTEPDFKFINNDKNYQNKLIIGFTSYGIKDKKIDNFELEHLIANLSCPALMLRDNSKRWFLGGVHGFGTCSEDIIQSLRLLGTKYECYTIGVSMGGYAALLYGQLIGAKKILVFSPQVRIDTEWRKQNNDTRWENEIRQVNSLWNPPGIDLVMAESNYKPDITIYYSADCIQDYAQVKLIPSCENVDIKPVVDSDHNSASALKKQGNFHSIIKKWLG